MTRPAPTGGSPFPAQGASPGSAGPGLPADSAVVSGAADDSDLVGTIQRSVDPAQTEGNRFFELAAATLKGAYSFPDDLGLSIVVTLSARGVFGRRMKENADFVNGTVAFIVCATVRSASRENLDYTVRMLSHYLENGDLGRDAAQLGGRVAGGVGTNALLFRWSKRMTGMGLKGREKIPVTTSMTLLACHGAACRAVVKGSRSLVGILQSILLGQYDPRVEVLAGQLDFRYDAPWRGRIATGPEDGLETLHGMLADLCGYLRRGR